MRAGLNLPKVKVLPIGGFYVYVVLNHARLVMTRVALEHLAGRLGEVA